VPYFENRRGLKIFYEEYNPSGEKCVTLLHGWGSSASFFANQIPMLVERGFHILAFDAEGHGKSEKAKLTSINDFTSKNRDHILQDFEDLARKLALPPRLGLIGHSLVGGGIAQLYALNHPDKVDWLGLLNTGTLLIDNVVRNVFWNALPTFIRIQYESFIQNPDNLFSILDKMIPFINLAISTELGDYKNPPEELNVLIQMEIQEMFSEPIPAENIQVPALIIGAELDDFAPLQLSKDLHAKIPGSELKIISMSGHFAPAHRWEEVNEYLGEFIDHVESDQNG